MDEVEDLLIGLILEGKVEGKIDQVSMRLELTTKYDTASRVHSLLLTLSPRRPDRAWRRRDTTLSTSGPTHLSPCPMPSSARRRSATGGQTRRLAWAPTHLAGLCARWRGLEDGSEWMRTSLGLYHHCVVSVLSRSQGPALRCLLCVMESKDITACLRRGVAARVAFC